MVSEEQGQNGETPLPASQEFSSSLPTMKFGKTLRAQALEAWRFHYMNYKQLKGFISAMTKREKSQKSIYTYSESGELQTPFEVELDRQLLISSTFYQQKQTQIQRAFNAFMTNVHKLEADQSLQSNVDLINSLMASLSQFNEELFQLRKFGELNYTGFRKIIKKHDKNLRHLPKLREYFDKKIEESGVFNVQPVDDLLSRVGAELTQLEQIRTRVLLKSSEKLSEEEELTHKLFDAWKNDDIETFKTLLASKRPTESVISQLFWKTVRDGRKDLADILFALNPDLQQQNELEQTLLHVADANCIDLVIDSIDLEKEDSQGRRPLHTAASRGRLEVVERLLARSVEVDPPDTTLATPLLLAASHGQSECVRALLKHGADANAKNVNRKAAIHLASAEGSSATLEVLLENGALVDTVDGKGQTALHIAIKMGHLDCVPVLIRFHPNMEIQDEDGSTVFHHTTFSGLSQTLSLLLSSMNDSKARERAINLADTNGMTPLHTGAHENHPECVQILLDYGAQKNVRDDIGWTPNVHASYVGNLPMEELLAVESPALHSPAGNDVIPSDFQQPDETVSSSSSQPQPAERNVSRTSTQGMTRVRFEIEVSVTVGQYVAVVGNRKILGSWDVTRAHPMLSKEGCNDHWVAEVPLPSGIPTEYRYIVCDAGQLGKWETLPTNRKVLPEGMTYDNNDGLFGVDTSIAEEIFIEEGWLINQSQLQVRFFSSSLKLNDDKGRGHMVTISANEPLNYHRVHFPLEQDRKTFVLQNTDIHALLSLQLDVYSHVGLWKGRATVHPSQLASGSETLTLPILSTSLTTVGSITVECLVVKPFVHEKNTRMLKHTYWRSTAVIGHRGGGAEASSKTGKYHRSHIRENTLLSFVTAASLGAEYVEFDVQLTKDKVPVIYHDFVLPIPGLDVSVPINNISLEQFKKLQLSQMGTPKNSPREDRTVKRSHSLTDIFDKKSSTDSLVEMEKDQEEAFIRDNLPTFRECFKRLPDSLGFNVEIKYPAAEDVKEEGLVVAERNEYVDTILNVVFDCAGDRNIFFSSFDPDVCILLRLKQPRYPVFFLTHGGTEIFSDIRMNSIQQAIRFAKSNHLMGIVSHAHPVIRTPQLVRSVKRTGLLLCTYGTENNEVANVDLQERFGVDAIIVDHVAYVSKHLQKPQAD